MNLVKYDKKVVIYFMCRSGFDWRSKRKIFMIVVGSNKEIPEFCVC